MRFGAHISIGGGFGAAAREAAALGLEAMQVFSRSPRGGKAKPLDGNDIETMRRVLGEAGIRPLVVHVPYFVNLGSDDPGKYGYSVEVLKEDMLRASALGASFVVTHPGHMPDGDGGHERVASAIREAVAEAPGEVRLLVENTSGQGREMGGRLEEVARILELIGMPERTGGCIDTCHAFAAGYDLRSAASVDEFVRDVDAAIGLERVFVMHLNDAKFGLGSKRDRHEHIGLGMIGEEGFRRIVTHPLLEGVAGVIETPVDDSESNLRNINTLKRMRAGS